MNKNPTNSSIHRVLQEDCLKGLKKLQDKIDLTFLDPPFNQKKQYASYLDDLPEQEYWDSIRDVSSQIFDKTSEGGALYFMQREKNSERVLQILRETGWTFQNLIIWKKMTSAVPGAMRYGKAFQVIAFVTKGRKPRVFNKLRIDPPLPGNYKYERKNGLFVTDIWDDIRELTSGYFAGDEAIRDDLGERFHKQQSPIALLLRIVLSSSNVGDLVLDPFSGTGTTAVVAKQLNRSSISFDIDSENFTCIEKRLSEIRKSDLVEKYFDDYRYTDRLEEIWRGGSIDSDELDRLAKTSNLA